MTAMRRNEVAEVNGQRGMGESVECGAPWKRIAWRDPIRTMQSFAR